jgi:hypothetical protein
MFKRLFGLGHECEPRHSFTGPIKSVTCDVDDTLAATRIALAAAVNERFPRARLTLGDLVGTFVQNTPAFINLGQAGVDFLVQLRGDSGFNLGLWTFPDVVEYLDIIHSLAPIRAYVTTRPASLLQVTIAWLRSNRFPEAPVICRPDDVSFEDATAWKVAQIIKLNPDAHIDDDSGVAEGLVFASNVVVFLVHRPHGLDYSGRPVGYPNSSHIIPCVGLQDVREKIEASRREHGLRSQGAPLSWRIRQEIADWFLPGI